MSAKVESFVLPSTAYVPNNKLPVIVYRDVLPRPHSELSATDFLQANKWEKKVTPLASSEIAYSSKPCFVHPSASLSHTGFEADN